MTAPVFAGDTIYAESEVIGKRESASRPHHGIVTVRTSGKKADGTVFMTFERSALIPMRGHAVDDRPAGIAEADDRGDLVERLAGRVVERLTDDSVSADPADLDELRMAARY